MKKKTWIVALILVAMVATMAIGLAACGTNLDGVYDQGDGTSYIKISGNKIQKFSHTKGFEEKLYGETTFTIEKDKLVLAGGKVGDYFEVTLNKDKTKLICKAMTSGGTEITETFTKVIDKK